MHLTNDLLTFAFDAKRLVCLIEQNFPGALTIIRFSNAIISNGLLFLIGHTENDTELHSKSVPVNTMLLTRSTTMNTATDLEKLTTSVETMRTSILQAYVTLTLVLL